MAVRPFSPAVLNLTMDNIGERRTLVEAYRLTGSTQAKFAKLMGVHVRTLARYLDGTWCPPPAACRAAIFAAMCSGVSMILPRPAAPPTGRSARSAVTPVDAIVAGLLARHRA